MLFPALSGFLLGGSLIIAIGAQNAYILRMGLLRHHVFWLCLFCALSDAALIILGIAGLGALVEAQPVLLRFIALGGALFLSAYAIIAFRRAFNPAALQAAASSKPTLWAAIAVCASLTWLNPHVYLDTVVLLGAYSTRYSNEARIAFGIGAALSSFVWFFSLGFGARLLAPLFAKPKAWQILDGSIALVMGLLSLSLYKTALGY
ncbi:MAG: LysE/ArgO family amino acid transporter [Salaquimonas sp.]